MSLLPKRQLYTRKTLKRLGDSLEPELREWLVKKVEEQEAKRRRAAAKKVRRERKAKHNLMLASIPQTMRTKDKRKARGFINPMLTRDGFAAPQPRRTRRSPSRLTKFTR